MRKKKKTIILSKIRKLIRAKARQFNLGDEGGNLTFWDREDYKRAKKVSKKKVVIGNYPYYSKSTRAIEDLAKEIYKVCDGEKEMEQHKKDILDKLKRKAKKGWEDYIGLVHIEDIKSIIGKKT